MAGPDIICVGAGKESQEVLKVFNYNLTMIFYLFIFFFNMYVVCNIEN